MMTNEYKLVVIKVIHSSVWLVFVAMIFYIVYAGLINQIDYLTWLFSGIIILEGFVLLAFGMQCPLTVIARKYSDATRDNFDIYLPNWLARHNKLIFTSVFIVGLILVLYRTLIQS